MMKRFATIWTIGLVVVLGSCLNSDNETDPYTLLLEQTAAIDSYLAANNLTAVKDISGIRMVIEQLGTGFPAVRPTSVVKVDYLGTLFEGGTKFDEGTVNGALSGYITGWQYALRTLPVGSKAKVYIPSAFGYGPGGQGPIPGNAILIFNITFKEAVRSSTELSRLAQDTVAIDQYLTDKGINAIKDTTGIRYVVTETGGGAIPDWYTKVKYHAKYRLLTDDTKIVAEYDYEPNDGSYSRVIDQNASGLQWGLQRLPAGSKATFYLPSLHGFGPEGAKETQSGPLIIPANANIIVDVEFEEIVP